MLLLHYDIEEAKNVCKVPKDTAFAFTLLLEDCDYKTQLIHLIPFCYLVMSIIAIN